MGHNSNNMGTTWVHQYNECVILITIRGYTNISLDQKSGAAQVMLGVQIFTNG